MIRRTLTMVAAATMLTMPLGVGMAQPVSNYPGLSVAFRDPTGLGSTTQSFEIWLRITNSAATDFEFDGSDYQGAFGLPGIGLPTDAGGQGYLVPFWRCQGSFTADDCGSGAPYELMFNVGDSSLYGVSRLFVGKEGGYYDFLLGTFVPTGGEAAMDTYRFFNAGFSVGVMGPPMGAPNVPFDLASTCAGLVEACAFERTIVGASVQTITPEPATFYLLGGGFAALLAAHRRRRNS